MHKQLSNDDDRYANHWLFQCKRGFLHARVDRAIIPPSSEVVKINVDDTYWHSAVFADGSTVPVQPVKWTILVEEAKGETDISANLWLSLIEAGLVDGDVEKLKAALAAKDKLKRAQEEYEQTLISLGASRKKIHGTYEDYQEWLEIPGLPMFRF